MTRLQCMVKNVAVSAFEGLAGHAHSGPETELLMTDGYVVRANLSAASSATCISGDADIFLRGVIHHVMPDRLEGTAMLKHRE